MCRKKLCGNVGRGEGTHGKEGEEEEEERAEEEEEKGHWRNRMDWIELYREDGKGTTQEIQMTREERERE